jgi:hypothetical protein
VGKDKEDFAAAAETGGEANPTPKIGMLVRHFRGRKDEAVNQLFDSFGKSNGVHVLVKACGLSRQFATPEDFPVNNLWVPGKEAEGMYFVKYECVD